MTKSFDYPNNTPMVYDNLTISAPWNQWFQRAQSALETIYASGPTAQRPTRMIWVGRQYFDTTLGYPVWVKSVQPAVWVNGAGVVV